MVPRTDQTASGLPDLDIILKRELNPQPLADRTDYSLHYPSVWDAISKLLRPAISQIVVITAIISLLGRYMSLSKGFDGWLIKLMVLSSYAGDTCSAVNSTARTTLLQAVS